MQDSQKRLLNGCYQLVKHLGEGGYGSVFLYRKVNEHKKNIFHDFFYSHNTDSKSQYFALKKYHSQWMNDKQGTHFSILRQINMLHSINHKNIACCHEIIHKKPSKGTQNPSNHHDVYAVLDFYLELRQILNNADIVKNQKDKKFICYEILQGMVFLHKNYIFHRDLKPQNIFVSRKGEIKISDFGFARQFGSPNGRYTANTCTKEYRAPQLFFRTHYYTEKCDIWSFGCILAYIFKSKTLFFSDSNTQMQVLGRIFKLRGTPNKNTWSAGDKFPQFLRFEECEPADLGKELQVEAELARLIGSCLELNPSKRPSAEELLRDKFFQDRSEGLFGLEEFYDEKLRSITNGKVKETEKSWEELEF